MPASTQEMTPGMEPMVVRNHKEEGAKPKGYRQPSLWGLSIDERFEAFHLLNPQVYDEFVKRALMLKALGYKHYSADAIIHSIRFDWAITTRSLDVFKINDHFTRCYARKAMAENPELDGFFETRRIRS